MHNYHDTVGSLPPGDLLSNGATNQWWGAFVMLLPRLEQGNLYNALNFSAAVPTNENTNRGNGGINSTVQLTAINVLQCPSDTDRLTTATGHINYASNAGSDGNSFVTAAANNNTVDAFLGPYGNRRSAIGLRDILDGTSNTAAFSERVKGLGTNNTSTLDTTNPRSTFFKATVTSGVPATDATACKAAAQTLANASTGDPSGFCWTTGDGSGSIYTHVMTPNSWSCAAANTWDNSVAATASSRHNGVVNVAMCDGSVRTVKNTIANTVWWAVGSMANNEVIDASASCEVTRSSESTRLSRDPWKSLEHSRT